MKCIDCIYYKASPLENECVLHGYLNFRTDDNCDLVDDNFNQLKDDMGNDCFIECDNILNNMIQGGYPRKNDIENIKEKLREIKGA